MLTVITACTSRKTRPPDSDLTVRTLPSGNLYDVARAWGDRINAASPVERAVDLYSGRDYRRTVRASAPVEPYIVSAGLGLLAPQTRIPAYSATISGGVEDSILAKIRGKVSPADWFGAVQSRSRYATAFRDLPSEGLVLVALPARYLSMIGADLLRLAPGRLRLFPGSTTNLDARLASVAMPYDGLLADVPGYNGPLVGFTDRALSHFLEHVLPGHPHGTVEAHQQATRKSLRDAYDAQRLSTP